jgi:hypothetical protein
MLHTAREHSGEGEVERLSLPLSEFAVLLCYFASLGGHPVLMTA